MTNDNQPEINRTTGSVPDAANDWFRVFCKNLDLNFVPNAKDLPFEADIPDYQIATLRAVLHTLIESGMITDSIRDEVHQFLSRPTEGTPDRRQFGLGKGRLKIIEDDDQHLEDFGDYMP